MSEPSFKIGSPLGCQLLQALGVDTTHVMPGVKLTLHTSFIEVEMRLMVLPSDAITKALGEFYERRRHLKITAIENEEESAKPL